MRARSPRNFLVSPQNLTLLTWKDELCCLYANAHYLTGYFKQREAESYLNSPIGESWDMLTTTTRSKPIYLRRHNRRRVRPSCGVLHWDMSFFSGNRAHPRLNTDHRVCVFDLVGSLCSIMTMLSFGIKILENLQSSLLEFSAE
jgi:hypothetical protein